MFVPYLDSKLATAVEATGGEIDGTDNRSHSVGEEQLGVKFQPFEFVYLDAHIIQDAQAPNALNQLLLLQLVRRPCHEMNFHPPAVGPHQAFDNDRVLIAFVLQPQGVLGLVDELAHSLPPISDTPDEMRMFPGLERLAVPVGFEAVADFSYFMAMRGDHRIVAGLRQVLRLPVERLYKRRFIIDNH